MSSSALTNLARCHACTESTKPYSSNLHIVGMCA